MRASLPPMAAVMGVPGIRDLLLVGPVGGLDDEGRAERGRAFACAGADEHPGCWQ